VRIAIMVPTFYEFSGIDRVAELQAKEFSSSGNQVTILTFDANMPPPPNVKLQVLGMPKGSLSQRIYRLLFPVDFVKAVKWVPKLKDFDVIYSHQYPMNWLAYLAKRFYKVRYVYYNHGLAPPWTFSSFSERLYMKMFIPLANWTIKRADDAISVSGYLQKQLQRETGLHSKVTYNRIDTNRFRDGIDGSGIRKKYNFDNAPLVLYVGRISPHKGVHLLIEAFNLTRQKFPDAKLMIVGKHTFGAYSNKLRKMSDASVIFTGLVSDEELPHYYAACDVYATCTLWEGFDLPLAEAQACGKPVVAFDIGPHKEVIDSRGSLVKAGDTKEFGKEVATILERVKGGKDGQ
jgi:1,2-diacylglycerol 3-alpha-glucosyltransferase